MTMKAMVGAGLALVLAAGCSLEAEDLFGDRHGYEDEAEVELADGDAGGAPDHAAGVEGSLDRPEHDGAASAGDNAQPFGCSETTLAPSCTALGFLEALLELSDVATGVYDVEGGGVSVFVEGSTMDFLATTGVRAVIVEGGGAALVCTYDSDVFSLGGLHAPVDAATHERHAIEHVTFCAAP